MVSQLLTIMQYAVLPFALVPDAHAHLPSKATAVQVPIDEAGARPGCAVVNQDGELIVGRDEAFYFNTLDGRGPCFACEGGQVSLAVSGALLVMTLASWLPCLMARMVASWLTCAL